eukprot:TRINITY_DN108144_c0_g1_i1.p1 TRINITY_DN108144_c0_g1~~TRINITY_DN108144_c0_g1_i1.p1  ORF type:complete len:222 (+),score=58.60 TRINITY_DN108144_c0_g1_i1:38-667(+)
MFASCMACKHDVSPYCSGVNGCISGQAAAAARSSAAAAAASVAASADGRSASVPSNPAAGEENGNRGEKDRLRSLVHKFTAEALKGVDCTLVDPQTGAKMQAVYRIDSEVRWLCFTAKESSLPLASLQLPWITRLAAYVELPSQDQEELLGCLGPSEAARCVEVSSVGSAGKGQELQRAILVMQDMPDAERFLTCIEVLRLYAAMDAPV